ncbi:uncharacterized protein STEHIDRAFT_89500 [Stereum hirsutum FP-91666 SS1]|uniref:uncharacterized protein n=1 Tax=Stereum hirsutum (strain FP-91666) TaxID=721885 RepID=UPI000440AC02|nr:uncharacterized protein STEHIDRAFT_89500 [Stereum hirsutum FP-91666 SS1]EIM92476.1 hypothetical protein STEHIDRAFT_89500 [Stereum hirsutum FP-91666 SS1]
MNSNFAGSFAPYRPPPDEQPLAARGHSPSQPSSSSRFTRPWFPTHNSSQQASVSSSSNAANIVSSSSYQSGAVPSWNTSAAGGIGSDDAEDQRNLWETRYNMRVDLLAAFAYILGPISALALLIFETHNDYVRFHAYQSAMLTTPLLLFRIFASIVGFPSFLCTILTLLLVGSALFMAYQAYKDATQNGLARFHLPGVGPLAEQWLQEE